MISIFWGGFFDNQSEFLSEKLMSKTIVFPGHYLPVLKRLKYLLKLYNAKEN